uniref:DUF6824 domain-containing protein n=1 Tax=Entomoneis paludosa TaxID=265537 RepID=A0A7S2YP44_9STRA|mmetsp:Transcript_40563/g.84433  ORF Transcript_40563/g.84433 Transcript_40563/m.84433 type:complete len:531 (+) Transcript_40563:46-1638(+)|eukprot:CAMPEP_0172465706 /NCGR_PEP_ID=MMETSP1065-20121228/54318_1 /TAXON_ID=265537 /ORGANISM="Amphiprora paludosa, Strain CCMP125" /LENGTH=530 /DNA_ID=CAMNT_0013222325 /DNA_START=42 /DNA_END=1634 /DNA_ORIENTATION=+
MTSFPVDILRHEAQRLGHEAQRHNRFLEIARKIGLYSDHRLPIPETTHEANLVEDVLASNLEKLSLDERELQQLQLYGLETYSLVDAPGDSSSSSATVESSEQSTVVSYDSAEKINIDKSLQEFDQLLRQKLAQTKDVQSAYVVARYWNPEYCEDRNFRLYFLRAEKWSVSHAVELFLYHFEMKRELFVDTTATTDSKRHDTLTSGNTKQAILGRPVRMSDLDPDDLETIRSGCYQIGKSTDDAGRTVIYISPRLRKFKSLRNLQRAFWYIVMSELQDKGMDHSSGVIGVISFYGFGDISIPHLLNVRRARMALPMNVVGTHICYGGDESQRVSIAGIQLFQHCNPKDSVLQVHQGEPKETFSKLRSFGIPVDHDNSPLLPTGESWSTEWHLEWLQNLKAKEERAHSDSADGDHRPRRFDVLFGKGKEALKHPGTLRCMHLVDLFENRYEAANRRAKTQVSDEIVGIIHASNGRFLKRIKPGGSWMEVDKATAREKISHLFRQKRSKAIAEKEMNKTEQSSPQKLQGVGE